MRNRERRSFLSVVAGYIVARSMPYTTTYTLYKKVYMSTEENEFALKDCPRDQVVSIRLELPTLEKLDELAKKKGIKRSELLYEIVLHCLKLKKPEA